MSGRLDHIVTEFERRLALRRRMLAHLQIDIPEDMATDLRPQIHATLIACATCPNPDICEGWIDSNHPGTPMFCRARGSFMVLDERTSAPCERRARA